MFLKRILGVKNTTSTNMIYYELGRYPLIIKRKLRIFRYWLKIRNSNNCLLKTCYEEMIQNDNEWVKNLKTELSKIGLGYLWSDNRSDKCILAEIENRITDIYKQETLLEISRSSKGFLYQHLIDNFTLQYYLTKPIPSFYKIHITRYRLVSHKLKIEQGRYTQEKKKKQNMFTLQP